MNAYAYNAYKLKEMRQLMGLKATELCKAIKMHDSVYSLAEGGEDANPATAIERVKPLFAEWRKGEIETLESKIKYLKSFG